MAATIEISGASTTCRRCGEARGRLKGNFPVSYAPLYKGAGYMSYCFDCIYAMFTSYLEKCDSPKDAVRQMCRKLDLYWSEKIYDAVERTCVTRDLMKTYIVRLNTKQNAGKCYDDTLVEEGMLWTWPTRYSPQTYSKVVQPGGAGAPGELRGMLDEPEPPVEPDSKPDPIEIPEDVSAFWGPGYTPEMYMELEDRKAYWISKYPDDYSFDIGEEALIRQICNLEIDINHDRAAGKPIDKAANTLNALLGSLNVKPAQKKEDAANAALNNTPFGVWIMRWEQGRPVPDPDPQLKDVDNVVKYVWTWVYGHLAKMFGIKNAKSKLYDDEIARYRVERPEYDDEDDDDFMYDVLSGLGGEDEE